MSYYINTGILQQCFSKINTFTNHMEILLRHRFWFSRTGMGQIFCFFFFYKLPSDPRATGPQTSLWVSRPIAQNISQWTWICVLSLNQASPHTERFFEFNKNWDVKRRAILIGNAIKYLQWAAGPALHMGLSFGAPEMWAKKNPSWSSMEAETQTKICQQFHIAVIEHTNEWLFLLFFFTCFLFPRSIILFLF